MSAAGREERHYGMDEYGRPDQGMRDQVGEGGPAQGKQSKEKQSESAIMRESRAEAAAHRPQEAEGRGSSTWVGQLPSRRTAE